MRKIGIFIFPLLFSLNCNVSSGETHFKRINDFSFSTDSLVSIFEDISSIREGFGPTKASIDKLNKEKKSSTKLFHIDSVISLDPGRDYMLKIYLSNNSSWLFKADKLNNKDFQINVFKEIAVYELDTLMGFNLTPPAIFQKIKYKGVKYQGVLIKWVENAIPANDLNTDKSDLMHFFDAIIGNSDRHDNNWLIINGNREVAIDHDRTFVYDYKRTNNTYWKMELKKINSKGAIAKFISTYKNTPENDFRRILKKLIDENLINQFILHREKILSLLEETG